MFDKHHPDFAVECSTSVTPGLEEALKVALASDLNPDCGEIFPVNVYNRELIADCKQKTPEEKRRMANRLLRKASLVAMQLCARNNGRCPDVELIALDIVRDECSARLWEIDARFTLRCFRRL